jgi:hypothetical protein
VKGLGPSAIKETFSGVEQLVTGWTYCQWAPQPWSCLGITRMKLRDAAGAAWPPATGLCMTTCIISSYSRRRPRHCAAAV